MRLCHAIHSAQQLMYRTNRKFKRTSFNNDEESTMLTKDNYACRNRTLVYRCDLFQSEASLHGHTAYTVRWSQQSHVPSRPDQRPAPLHSHSGRDREAA